MEKLLERIVALEGLHRGERARRQALEARVQALEKRLAEITESFTNDLGAYKCMHLWFLGSWRQGDCGSFLIPQGSKQEPCQAAMVLGFEGSVS